LGAKILLTPTSLYNQEVKIMKITVRHENDELVLAPEGRIDTHTFEEFEKALMKAIDEADCVRVDFEQVDFISSAGLRALLNGQKKVNKEDKEMICANINEVVEAVFDSTGFSNVLVIE
jgi:anti-sigma B factor antagonist